MLGSKKVSKTISDLDHYLDQLDECVLVFKSGVKNYLEGNQDPFAENLRSITALRNSTAELRRSIENNMYTHALLLDNRVEILQLLESLDQIINMLYKYLYQYEIEIPFFPSELTVDFLKLVEVSSLSVEGLDQAVKDYFRMPKYVTEKIHRIYYFEKEVSRLAQSIKHHVFHDLDSFKLSQKIHMRYFTLHVEELAEDAVKAADLLSIMVLKQSL